MAILSKPVLKQSIKSNWVMWLVFTGILIFYAFVMVFAVYFGGDMFGDILGGPVDISPAGLMLNLVVMMFYDIMGIGFILVLIYVIIIGNKLVASEVDKGSLSFILNTPITRKQIVFSKALFFIASITAMILIMTLIITISTALVGVGLDFGALWRVALGFWLYSLALSGFAFAASCIFNKSRFSILLGAGIPLLFFLITTLAQIDPMFYFLRIFSLNTLFDTANIVAATNFIWKFAVLGVIAIGLYAVGIARFLKKDLPI